MFNKGETDLSRARGATRAQAPKANRQKQHYEVENTIDFNPTKKPRMRQIEIVPKSRGQENLVLSLLDPQVVITIAVGPAGTGKTYLAMQAAIKALRTGEIEKIILTRPAVGVDDEKHGFLPGDLNQKMEPWTRPLLDVLHEYYSPKDVAQMLTDQIIEISPLAFMRGRTFKAAYIIADEMQNATPSQMKMLLTRIGVGSRIVVTGDVEQADRTTVNNGLIDIAARLERTPSRGLQVCKLGVRDVQRHPIINTVLEIYSD
jgi:phosphate starvation-inducible protein PhoH and related proteins